MSSRRRIAFPAYKEALMRILALLTVLLVPAVSLAQVSGQIIDLGHGTALYSDTQGNSGMIQNLGGGHSTFSGTQGLGSIHDLGGAFSTYSFTPFNSVPPQPLFEPPPQPSFDWMEPTNQHNRMKEFYTNQVQPYRLR